MRSDRRMAISTLENTLGEEAREALLADIEAQITRHDVRHVYVQYTSVPGRVMGKALPAGHFARIARKGLPWANVSAGGFTVGLHGSVIGPDAVAITEGLLIPDLQTFRVLPWDTDMARVICDHYNGPDAAADAGLPHSSDGRTNLKRLHDDFQADFGVELRTGCEPEMSWFPSREQIGASISLLPGHIGTPYHINHIEESREILKRVTRYGQAMGLDMIQADYEDPGQIEMNFMFGPCLDTADRLTTYRQICIQVARELDMLATFMPKPVASIMGNGCHHHVSLWRGEEPAFGDGGPDGLNELGRFAMGGILKHAHGMSAVCAPTVNSYARYWDPGQYAPTVPVWGVDNRQCLMRVLGNRAEFRAPDASCNPYLTHAVLLAAIRDGIENEVDPGDCYVGETPPEPGDSQFPSLPRTLGEALVALQADEVIRAALPGELYETFFALKQDEWHRSCGAITDWQTDTYLNYLP
jgi:glutamine synthetase